MTKHESIFRPSVQKKKKKKKKKKKTLCITTSTCKETYGRQTHALKWPQHTEIPSRRSMNSTFKKHFLHNNVFVRWQWKRSTPRHFPSLWESMNSCLLGEADAPQSVGITRCRWGPCTLLFCCIHRSGLRPRATIRMTQSESTSYALVFLEHNGIHLPPSQRGILMGKLF